MRRALLRSFDPRLSTTSFHISVGRLPPFTASGVAGALLSEDTALRAEVEDCGGRSIELEMDGILTTLTKDSVQIEGAR